ncbi:hypothetical protein [uncultured Cloacibacillus sp.]|uniref:hypothetical protein n=1 Tax=uncultured Cloacibacillus sp. TaxID=889794 RepID=UPI0027D99BE3|nr:hypothetical protein [uncultured Cloacibacillus sp.]
MTEAEIREELESVHAAIKAIREGAQEYSTPTRTVKAVDYKTLLEERRDLEFRLASATGQNFSLGGWCGR